MPRQLLRAAGAALLQPRCSFAVGLLPTGKVFDSAANCVGAEPEVSPAHGAGTAAPLPTLSTTFRHCRLSAAASSLPNGGSVRGCYNAYKYE